MRPTRWRTKGCLSKTRTGNGNECRKTASWTASFSTGCSTTTPTCWQSTTGSAPAEKATTNAWFVRMWKRRILWFARSPMRSHRQRSEGDLRCQHLLVNCGTSRTRFFFLKEEKNMKTSTNLFWGNPFQQISQDLENKCNNHVKDGYFLIPRGDGLMGLGAHCPPNTSHAYFDANYCKGHAARMIGKYTYSHSYTSQPDCRPSKDNKLVYWKPLYKNGKPDKESCGLPTSKQINDFLNKKTARFRGYNSMKWGGDLQCGSCYRYTGSRHRMDCK